MTPTEIHDLIVHLLAGATGKPEKHWRKVVGKVEALPLVYHPTGNWRVEQLSGSPHDVEAAEKAIALVEAENPYVSEGWEWPQSG